MLRPTAAAAAAALTLALTSATILAQPMNISASPPMLNWTADPDPQNKPYFMPEPADEETKVYRCWGYLARGKATAEMRAYILRGIKPSSNTCDGVNRLHPNCWPIMFTSTFPKVNPGQLQELRQFCQQKGTLPPADHFRYA